MICPKCNFEQDDQNSECPACGIIFAKYHKQSKSSEIKTESTSEDIKEQEITVSNFFRDFFFDVKPLINPFYFGGRIIVFLIILVWGWVFIFTPLETNYTGTSFLHLVNLPFHEFGHIIFRPFSPVITSLGGSLGQLLMPLTCLLVFLIKTKDTFGASVALWWFGENFMDIAPYINDARSLTMPLLGGNTGQTSPYGFHDWEFILNELGWLHLDHLFASIAYKTGIIIMIISFAWAGYILFKQYKNLDLYRTT
jgi:hypothetical protein